MKGNVPEAALLRLADRWRDCDALWLVGGSTGLALRGAALDREPRDLDVYADGEAMAALHDRLADVASDKPSESETERYRSILSHYQMEGTTVELVGDFRIAARGSLYRTEVSGYLYESADRFVLEGRVIPLIPLAHELLFNLLRERLDRAEAIAALMKRDMPRQGSEWRALVARHRISKEVQAQAEALLGLPHGEDRR